MAHVVEAARTKPLADVLAYRNDRVVDSFLRKFAVTREEAEAIFTEVRRWLWYVASTKPTADNPEAHGIDEAMFIIDEMWHTFILVTRDYAAFCEEMFGRFLHHDPGSAGSEAYGADYSIEEGEDREAKIVARTMTRKRAKYLDIHERLGEEVFLRWYDQFPQAYSVDAIYRLRKR